MFFFSCTVHQWRWHRENQILKACCVRYFYQIFIFSLNDNPLKIMENVFLFHHNSCFCSRIIQTFVIFSLSTLSRFKRTYLGVVIYDVMN